MSINGQASTVFANTISGLDTLNVSNITVNGVDLTATYVPYQNANSDVNLGIRNLTGTSIIATTSMTTPTPTLSDNSTLVSTTAFVKSQGYIGTAGLANYALLSGATFTGPISTTNISVSGTSSIAGYVSDTSLNTTLSNYLTNAFANATFLTISNASSTYLTISNASGTYLTISLAGMTYATIASLSAYLTQALASSTYLTISNASSTYLTISNASSTYATIGSLSNYALKSGTTFTGAVNGLTATLTDNDTKFATTAFVKGQNYITSSALTPYAPLASPTFTGTVSAPTPSTSDNTTKVATTQYVKSNLASYAPLTNATFTTPFRVNGATTGSFTIDANSNLTVGSILGGANCEFATFTIRGGGIINPINALLGIDANGDIWRTAGIALAEVTTTNQNVNYSIIGTTQDSGALSIAYIDALPTSFYFNPYTGILSAPSITTTATSSIFGYLTTASAASTYLTIANASSTYLTIANASTTYLPLSGGTLYSVFAPILKLTLDSTGNTNYLISTLIVFAGAYYTGTLYADSIHYATNNCYYGVGASKSHKFYVQNSNRLEIDSVKTVITGQLGVNTTTPVGALSVLLDGTADNNPFVWTAGHALFGSGANSSTGSAVALTYNTAGNYGALICLTPSVAWRDMYYSANSHSFKVGNTNLMTINGAGNVVATGTITGSILIGNNITLNGVPDFRIIGGGINFYLNNVQCGFWDKPDASTWRISAATSSYLSLNAPTKVSLQVGYTEYLGIAPTFLTTPNTLSTSGLVSFGQIHVNYGGYNVMQRNDGGAYYILIGNGVDAQWNGFRPFYITLNDGKLFSQNSQSFNGGCNIDVLSLNTTSQQSYQPRQVLIGNNQNVVQYGQLNSYAFRCGGGGIGWSGGIYMNTSGGQSGTIGGVADNFMIKYSSSSKITISGTFSGYVGSSGTMNCIFYFYNYYTGAYTYVGQWSQFSNVGSNHAAGGLHATLEFLPTGNYLVYMYGTGVNTDYNDHCSFSVIIHP